MLPYSMKISSKSERCIMALKASNKHVLQANSTSNGDREHYPQLCILLALPMIVSSKWFPLWTGVLALRMSYLGEGLVNDWSKKRKLD